MTSSRSVSSLSLSDIYLQHRDTEMTPSEFMTQYENALGTQSWAVVEPLMDDAVSVTFSTGTFRGKEAVQKIFEHNFSVLESENYEISDLHWVHEDPTHAVCQYLFNWTGLIQGKPASGGGRGTSVLINRDGHWALLTEHLGPPPA